MKIILNVKDFGKIKQARVDISNFVVFVGDNNSGKSLMMQLIYGVLKRLSQLRVLPEDFFASLGIKDCITAKEIKNVENAINIYLAQNKKEIINEIFNKEILIRELYLELEDIDESVKISYEEKNHVRSEKADVEEQIFKTDRYWQVRATLLRGENIDRQYNMRFLGEISENTMRAIAVRNIICMLMKLSRSNGKALYLPASRAGLLLLYKQFFAGNKEVAITDFEYVGEEVCYGNRLGLTQPTYDFLRFLIGFTRNEYECKHNHELIHFIETNLTDGVVDKKGEEDIYIPNGSDIQVPLYLASSMINELTPVLRLLMGGDRYGMILYDEIETCLHPAKQMEMARLLMRLNNAGIRLVVSTHSDTMATKINNLLLLTNSEWSDYEKQKKLAGLNLKEQDLLKSKDIHVYQFELSSDSKCSVKELEFRRNPLIGFAFEMFDEAASSLYEENKCALGMSEC